MTLNIKLFRDFVSKLGSNIAIILLITIGLVIYGTFSLLKLNLEFSTKDFYEKGNLADCYVNLRAIPFSKVKSLEEVNGIKNVQGRIVDDFRAEYEGSSDELRMKVISYKNSDELNTYILDKGKYPEESKRQIVIDRKFAEENSLDIGDEIDILTSSGKYTFTITGIGANPEFAYLVKNSYDLYPNYKTYGASITSLADMEILTNTNGNYNNIIFNIEKDANFDEIKNEISPKLSHYGLTEIFEKDKLFSYMMLDSEIKEATSMSVLLPAVFLAIACLIEFMMVERLVKSQRGQIGVLKAFGYKSNTILFYYIKYCMVIGFVGSVLGLILSIPLLNYLIDVYNYYFNLPIIYNDINFFLFAIGLIFGVSFSSFAGYLGAKDIARLNPVDSMSPEEPKFESGSRFMDKFLFLFNVTGTMSLRNTLRNKKRTLFIFLGITLTFALTSLTFIVTYVVEDMIFDRYNYVEKYDAKINFKMPIDSIKAMNEINERKGVLYAEPILEAPATLYHKNKFKDTVITGTYNNLYSVVNNKNEKISLEKNDFKISERLAKILDIKVGDTVYIKSIFLENNEEKEVICTGIVKQNLGMGIYMRKDSLENLLDLKNTCTSIIIKSDKKTIKDIDDYYEDSLIVSKIQDKENAIKNMSKQRESFNFMTYVFAFLGIVMGFIVVYNSYIVSINERQRELSSMMVLGFSKKEVSEVVSLEQWIISGFAIVCGIPISKLILMFLSWGVSNDMMTVPTDLKPIGFVIGLFCTLVSILIAQIMGFKKINELSIVEVLKERD